MYDIHSPRIPSVEEIEQTIKQILAKVPIEKVWINPDCGLKTRGEKETKASLIHLVQAALGFCKIDFAIKNSVLLVLKLPVRPATRRCVLVDGITNLL